MKQVFKNCWDQKSLQRVCVPADPEESASDRHSSLCLCRSRQLCFITDTWFLTSLPAHPLSSAQYDLSAANTHGGRGGCHLHPLRVREGFSQLVPSVRKLELHTNDGSWEESDIPWAPKAKPSLVSGLPKEECLVFGIRAITARWDPWDTKGSLISFSSCDWSTRRAHWNWTEAAR